MLRQQHGLFYDKPASGLVDAYLVAEYGRLRLRNGMDIHLLKG